ncbi:ATP-binding protein [Sphaerisporangium sp. NBC_01403]|uniref:ATP-binding protein n=1 Tax=Sphaerisporangium TaxID=321315 RepID=UPI00325697DF
MAFDGTSRPLPPAALLLREEPQAGRRSQGGLTEDAARSVTVSAASPALTARAQLEMATDPLAPKKARDFTAETLRTWGEHNLVEDATLVVSELATNAFRHGHRRLEELADAARRDIEKITLILELWPDAVGVRLQDSSPVVPAPRVALDDQEDGRGLRIVSAVASSWTVSPVAADGKQITAFLRRDGRTLPHDL